MGCLEGLEIVLPIKTGLDDQGQDSYELGSHCFKEGVGHICDFWGLLVGQRLYNLSHLLLGNLSLGLITIH